MKSFTVSRRCMLAASAGAVALFCGHGAAFAAPDAATSADEPKVEEVVVTASRVQRSGFTAPTPTTVLGHDELEKTGASNVGQLMTEIPSFQPTLTPTTTTISSQQAGGNYIDLRGLGPNRTLVLVDGRRHVETTADGAVDTNVIPSSLIDRVEVVTGGASAAWGSDAVAGVVNLILRKDLQGFEGDVHGGISSQGDNKEWGLSLAYGTTFSDNRGHFMIGGEAVDNSGVLHQGDRAWGRRDYQLIQNPNYTPTNGQAEFLVASNTHMAIATEGGLILSGVNAGTQFLSGGNTAPFQIGADYSGLVQVGGDGINPGRATELETPLERQNIFSHVSYDVSDNISAFLEGSYAHTNTQNDFLIAPFTLGDIAISSDNPFLPASIRNSMIAAGESAFALGRYDTDIGFIRADDSNRVTRFVGGLDGKFGDTWKWNAYYQYGQTQYDAYLHGNLRPDRLALAADVVTDPATGNPVCRSTLTDPTNGCVPINLIGPGAAGANQAAIDYVTGDQALHSKLEQQVAAASIQGEPFSTWAGPVSIAAGGEYRKESVKATVDAVSAADGFLIGNPKALEGSYDVKEGFVETVIPLLHDAPFAKELDFNGAVRETDYSTSGAVTTWKAGLSWSVDDQLRFRATRSRDIRAANLSELFTASQLLFTGVTDPATGNTLIVKTLRQGNPNLKPEQADTTTLGVVVQPNFLPGFRASVDYYNVRINGVISTLQPQDLIDRCFQGNTALCAFVNRDANGDLVSVILSQVNLSELKTRGVDFEASYFVPLDRLVSSWKGALQLRGLATYTDRFILDDGVTAVNYAGDVGSDVAYPTPKWRWNLSATYTYGPLTAYLAGRYVAGGNYDHTLGNLIDIPKVDSRFYVDASLAWTLVNNEGRDVQLYGVVKNLFDKDPPVDPSNFFLSPTATNPILYDVIGRTFTVGLRFKY